MFDVTFGTWKKREVSMDKNSRRSNMRTFLKRQELGTVHRSRDITHCVILLY